MDGLSLAALKPLETIAFPSASSGPSLSPIETDDVGSGGQYASRRVQGTFRHNWNMDQYPFDRQQVVIPIDETRYTAQRLVFEPDARESFLTPDIRERLDEWQVSDLTLEASVSEEASTYGLPGADGARYARLEAAVTLERAQYVPFFKLTSGVFAGVFIAFLSFFYDPNDRGGFGGKLGLLVGVLFAVLVNLRTADTSIGDASHLTLVTRIHLVTLAVIVVLALVALRDRRRVERGLEVRHPDWPMLAVVGGALRARGRGDDRSCGVVVTGGLPACAPAFPSPIWRRQIGARLPAPGRRVSTRPPRQARTDYEPTVMPSPPRPPLALRPTGSRGAPPAPRSGRSGVARAAGAGERLAARGRLA